jgi:hypothetical protein
MSNNNSLYTSSFSDKFSITKIIDKIDFIKKCSTGIVLFTLISSLITFENYRKNINNKYEIINKINEKNKINQAKLDELIEKNKINESKLDELIETNKLIIKMLEKHDEKLNQLMHYPLITFVDKNSLNSSSASLSDISLHSEKEDKNDEDVGFLNYCSDVDETEKSVESNKSNKMSFLSEPKFCETDMEDQELLNECYDNFPCNNSKKASGLNKLFGWK